MTKANADKIKEAAAAPTDEKALSVASATESPPRGDGKAPYKDDMETIYARLDMVDQRLKSIEARIDTLTSSEPQYPDKGKPSLVDRVSSIEKRLEGNIA